MIRPATSKDLDTIDRIAEATILDMEQSNIPQWDLSYPRRNHFAQDVVDGTLFVYEENGAILGAMALRVEQDPPYTTITGWHAPHGKSLVIHRVVVDPTHRRQGVFHQLMDFAKQQTTTMGYQSIKIDTHPDNYKMSSFLQKHGFVHIGYLAIIHREAYEWISEATI